MTHKRVKHTWEKKKKDMHKILKNLLNLPGEDVLVEVVLQLLVGYVDAKLLKAVFGKIFKAKDVQHSEMHKVVDLFLMRLEFRQQGGHQQ